MLTYVSVTSFRLNIKSDIVIFADVVEKVCYWRLEISRDAITG
jgi:hypothetical protein